MTSMQMRFSHIINKLENLGKTTYDQDCANKILRSMCREWQPKVTANKKMSNLEISIDHLVICPRKFAL